MSGTAETIEFANMNKYDVSNTDISTKSSSNGGFYVSTAKAFILVLLSILIAVVIALIVHFAGAAGKQVVCNCPVSNGGNQPSEADRITQCKNWAEEGNNQICSSCQDMITMKSSAMMTTTRPPKEKVDVRLPLNTKPIHYDVELQPNMYNNQPSTFTFDGKVRISIQCVTATNKVTIQINKLNITANTMRFGREGGVAGGPAITTWSIDKLRQFLIVNLDGMMEVNQQYFLSMSFSGPLKDDLAGLYLSRYDYNNVTKYMATTQLQPTDARRVFPCYDEPAIKATFNITLVRKSSTKSISNMPIIQNIPRGNDMVADVYQITPIMSTYLLAFIVGDLEKIQQTTTNNIQYGAWSTLGKTDQATYALDTGVKILTFFENYFETPFPLPKQDMVAMPDFSAGAMENWGLIIYRETAMLYKPGVSSEGNKQRVAVVVSHELAHQWFGNLVTPSWWDDLWLNEGFASFVEYMGVDYVHPDWKMFEQFVVEDLQDVFDFDGLTTSHPVYVPVGHPEEINEIFDRVSYAKGASIIRMMRFFLGENTFKLGLKRYLQSKKYGAAFHDDLWSSLTQQAQSEGKDINVKAIMDTWTLQMNYPVVKVTKVNNNRLMMRQERFLRDPAAVDPMKYTSPFGYKWTIPFIYTTSTERNYDPKDTDVIWMSKDNDIAYKDVTNLPTSTNSWILANTQQYGFYRVNYDDSNWLALINQLNTQHTAIPTINRAQIINDAWHLAAAGRLKMEIALRTIEYLGDEMEYVPRRAAVRQLQHVERMLSKSAIYGAWKAFVLSRVRQPFDILTMNNTGASHLNSYVRSNVVATACDYDLPDCTGNATQLYNQWMNNPSVNPIDPGIKTQVYCTAISAGGIQEWDFAFKQYKDANVAAEKSRLLQAMACTRETWLLGRYMTKAIRREDIRKQDTLSVIMYVSDHTAARSLVWDFVRENWNIIAKDFAVSLFQFTNMISRITRAFNTDFELSQVRDFIESQSNNLGSGQRAFHQAVEKTQSNIKWMSANYNIIKTWLNNLGFN